MFDELRRAFTIICTCNICLYNWLSFPHVPLHVQVLSHHLQEYTYMLYDIIHTVYVKIQTSMYWIVHACLATLGQIHIWPYNLVSQGVWTYLQFSRGAGLPAPWLLKPHYPSTLHPNECPPGKGMCACVCVAAVEKVCEHLYVYECVHACLFFWSTCVPVLVWVFLHTSPCSLACLESSLCVAAGHKNNLYLHKVM